MEYIKIKEWEEKFDREQKLKEQQDIRREQRLMQREMEKKSKFQNLGENDNKPASGLENFNINDKSKEN